MQHIDLYSGIGGFSLAGDWMGWRTIQFCEIDAFCQKVLKKHWSGVPIHPDIKTLTVEQVKNNGLYDENKTTIITGGVPCQPWSVAGKRKGTDDNRNLWPETITFIKAFQPDWVVLENVPGIINWNEGVVFEQVQSDLESGGYEVQAFVFPACAVGAWHRRDRVWIVANARCKPKRSKIESKQSPNNTTGRCSRENGRSKKNIKDVSDTNKFNGNKSRFHTSKISQQQTSQIQQNIITDTKSEGLQGQSFRQMEKSGKFTKSSQDVSDTDNKGLQGYGGLGKCRRKCIIRQDDKKEYTYRNCRKSESGICRMADGISYWLHEPDGIPRVATGIKDRVNRLKSLGNAIVPQVVFQIFKAIEQYQTINK